MVVVGLIFSYGVFMCLRKVSHDVVSMCVQCWYMFQLGCVVVLWLVCHCCCVLCAYARFCVGSRLFCQCYCDCLFQQGCMFVLGCFSNVVRNRSLSIVSCLLWVMFSMLLGITV